MSSSAKPAAHKRVIFSGNGYDESWPVEAERRGLLNLRTTPDAVPQLIEPGNVAMLTREKVYTEAELRAHYEIKLDVYNKTVMIEADTMSDMVRRQILPAVAAFADSTAACAMKKRALFPDRRTFYEERLCNRLCNVTEAIDTKCSALEEIIGKLRKVDDAAEKAASIRDLLIPAMTALRNLCDSAETLTGREHWPFPTYADLLFGVY